MRPDERLLVTLPSRQAGLALRSGCPALALLPFLLAAAVPAALGLLTTTAAGGAFPRAPEAGWAPLWAVRTVWSALLLLVAVAAWLVWCERDAKAVEVPIALWWTQLTLQALWPCLFLLRGVTPRLNVSLWLVLGVVVLLMLAIAATAASFVAISRTAAVLMAALLAWVMVMAATAVGTTVLLTLF